jgi:hypothetical protein
MGFSGRRRGTTTEKQKAAASQKKRLLFVLFFRSPFKTSKINKIQEAFFYSMGNNSQRTSCRSFRNILRPA